eukprot:8775248-Ditylum_brightwellii.AAC.2
MLCKVTSDIPNQIILTGEAYSGNPCPNNGGISEQRMYVYIKNAPSGRFYWHHAVIIDDKGNIRTYHSDKNCEKSPYQNHHEDSDNKE